MPGQWYIDGKPPEGPFRLAELQRRAAEGTLQPYTLLQSVDSISWTPAAAIDGLFLTKSHVAPPVPPPVSEPTPPPISAYTPPAPPPLPPQDKSKQFAGAAIGLATLVVLLVGLLGVRWLWPTKDERTAKLRSAVRAALAEGRIDDAPPLLEKIETVDATSAELPALRTEWQRLHDERTAQLAREKATAQAARDWGAAQQAIERGQPQTARHHLQSYLKFEQGDHRAAAQQLLDECEWVLSEARVAGSVGKWDDAKLAAAIAEEDVDPATPLPRHPALAKLTRAKLVAAAKVEQQRRVDEAVKLARDTETADKLRDKLRERVASAWTSMDVWLEDSRRRALTPLKTAQAKRMQEDDAWRADVKRHGALALVPENAAATIVISNPQAAWKRVIEFCTATGNAEMPLAFALYGAAAFPFAVDWSQPVLVVLPTAPPAELIKSAKTIVVVAAYKDLREARTALKTQDNALLRENSSVGCQLTGLSGILAFVGEQLPEQGFVRLRGKHLCFGFDEDSVDRVATATSIAPRLPAEVGARLLESDIAIVSNTSAWQAYWAWFFTAISEGIANREDPESKVHADNFIALAGCVEYGALSVQLDKGIGLSAFGVFSPHQDAAVERIVPLLVSSDRAAHLSGLPHDRALWAFAASGDGPSNVVIAHGLLLTAVDHFLAPRSKDVNRTDLHRAVTQALRNVHGTRAALYASGNPNGGAYSSLVIIDSPQPEKLVADLRALVDRLNAELAAGHQGNADPPPRIEWKTSKLDGDALHSLVLDEQLFDPALKEEAVRQLGAEYRTINLMVERRAIILHLGDDLDLLRQCRRNLAERRAGLAGHPAISARDKIPGLEARIRFHLAAQYFMPAQFVQPVGLPLTPATYTSSELSLDLTRVRLDLFLPLEELLPFFRANQGF